MAIQEMLRDLEKQKKITAERQAIELSLTKLLGEAEVVSKDYAFDTGDMRVALGNLFYNTQFATVSTIERTSPPPAGSSVYIFGNDSGCFKVWYEFTSDSTSIVINFSHIPSSK